MATDRKHILQNIDALRTSLSHLEFAAPGGENQAGSVLSSPRSTAGSTPGGGRHVRRSSAPEGIALDADPEKARAVVASQLRDLYTQLQSLAVWAQEVAGVDVGDEADGSSSAASSARFLPPAVAAALCSKAGPSTGASTPKMPPEAEESSALRGELLVAKAQVAALEHALASKAEPPKAEGADELLAHCDSVLAQVLRSAESGIVGRKERELVRSAVSNARSQLRRRNSVGKEEGGKTSPRQAPADAPAPPPTAAPPPPSPSRAAPAPAPASAPASALPRPTGIPRPSGIPRAAPPTAGGPAPATPPASPATQQRARSSAPKAKEAAVSPQRPSPPAREPEGSPSAADAALRREVAALRESLREATAELLVRREEVVQKSEQLAQARVRIAELEEGLERQRRAGRSRRRLRPAGAGSSDDELEADPERLAGLFASAAEAAGRGCPACKRARAAAAAASDQGGSFLRTVLGCLTPSTAS